MAGNWWDAAPIVQSAGASASPKAEVQQDGRVKTARQLRAQLDRVEKLYNQDFKGGDAWQSIMEMNPFTDRAKRFNAAASGLSPYVTALTRVPGSGTVSDNDQRVADRAFMPDSQDFDAANEERIAQLRRLVNSIDPPAPASPGKSMPRPAANTAPKPMSGPVKIGSDAEYDRLPKGRQYVGPDGVVRVK